MSPWRRRDFRLLWAGGLVNDTGDWVLTIALPAYILIETGSGLTTALLFLAQIVPTALLGPFTGNLVDRWNLRRTVVVTNLAQAIAVLPLLAVTPQRTWPAFVVAVTQAVLTRFNNPATASLLVRVVAPDELTAANAARATSENLARLVGAPLGGIIVAFGGLTAVVAVDGLSFVLVAVATAGVRSNAAPLIRPTHPSGNTTDTGTVAGLRVLRRTRPLPALLATTTIGQIAQGMFLVLFIAFVVRGLGGDEADIGLIRGMQAVGGVIGGVLIATRRRRAQPSTLIGVGFVGMAIWGAVFWNLPALTTSIGVYAVLMAATGPAATACGVGITTAVQEYTPAAYLGLYIGTTEAAAAVGQGVGALAAGTLLDRVALAPLLNVEVALYLLTAIVGTRTVHPAPHQPIETADHASRKPETPNRRVSVDEPTTRSSDS